MHRFFVPPSSILADQVVFPADISHQICRVLRLPPGTRVVVLDGLGNEYEVEISELDPRAVQSEIRGVGKISTQPSVILDLYVSLTQREKFEWLLQKCCEVGASSFTPFISSRSLVQDSTIALSKMQRWQKILQEAAEQCGRHDIPTIHPPLRWAEVLHTVQNSPLAILAWEREQSVTLPQVLENRPRQVAALVGPEGGFSKEEVQSAQSAGVQLITLGPRILRMETAAIVLTTLVMHELEMR